jgi:NitT/TauT family transport system substrate-binding protein
MKLYGSAVRNVFTCLSLLLAVAGGCGGGNSNSTGSASLENREGERLEKVTLMLNWYPEAEHGGFYAAKVHGIYAKHGLDVEIRAGGPSAPVAQELVTGRVQFGVGNADDVLLFRQQEAKLVALLAPIHNTPRCVVVREDSGVTRLDGLKGMILQANHGRPFLDYMQSKKMLEGVQVVPYGGSVMRLVSDKNTAVQGYSFSEPFVAEQQGVKVRALMLSDIGYNPYASCLMATEDFVTTHRDVVDRMTAASQEGWLKYFEDATLTNQAILAENKEGMTAEALEYGVEKLRELCLPAGMAPADLGKMSAERWSELIDQFVDLGLVERAKVTEREVWLK